MGDKHRRCPTCGAFRKGYCPNVWHKTVEGTFSFAHPPRATARHTDPDTSQEAAQSFSEDRITECMRDVLDQMARHNGRATDEQLDDWLKHKYHAQTTVSKRRTDLMHMGYVRDSGKRIINRNLRNMIVWELTEEGRNIAYGKDHSN